MAVKTTCGIKLSGCRCSPRRVPDLPTKERERLYTRNAYTVHAVTSSPGHSQILSHSRGKKSPRLRDTIWEWPGDEAIQAGQRRACVGHLSQSSCPLQSENESNDPLKSGPALAGPAGPATPPLHFERNSLLENICVFRVSAVQAERLRIFFQLKFVCEKMKMGVTYAHIERSTGKWLTLDRAHRKPSSGI